MTPLPRIAWTERSRADERLLLVVDLRPVAGATVGVVLMATPVLAAPLGRLSSPFALLVTLPTLALTLEAFGVRDGLASRLVSIRRPLARLMTNYAIWLITSAILSLDVAAVASASIAITAAGEDQEERRWQLGGAILGSNVGSLLLPFSNLTNMVLVSATGMGLAAYVGLAVWPQLAAALAVGLLLAVRARKPIARGLTADGSQHQVRLITEPPGILGKQAGVAGVAALVSAAAAVAVGLVGGDMAVPFAIAASLLATAAVASGRLTISAIIRTVPLAGLVIIVLAAVASAPMATVGGLLPQPQESPGGLLLALAVGSVLAIAVNNLPAAAFGATWLARAHPAAIIAFLIGTNVAALATPHGSVATLLARAVGARHGVATPARAHLGSAWRYASIGVVAAILALLLVAR